MKRPQEFIHFHLQGPIIGAKITYWNLKITSWSFLEKFLSRRGSARLDGYLVELKYLEQAARDCYSEIVQMSSSDFIETMLLDGCFIIELTRHLNEREEEDKGIETRPISYLVNTHGPSSSSVVKIMGPITPFGLPVDSDFVPQWSTLNYVADLEHFHGNYEEMSE
ncbi:hypothetical protein Tsubulata_009017 [Turnera subulata]|uniref:Uncharacterized protein n=1 Tax=Turnera subulata TaxID=218843 RepID=A0A9Q0FKR5_9ROSI|nr:hypothetical protein Tsubulata_009017 [Turnera subulata]